MSSIISVEADVSDGLPMFDLVGYLGSEVREARERVRISIKNSGFRLQPKRITVNLSPADIRKEGTAFDLPIAVAILSAFGFIHQTSLEDTLFIGEVGLNGDIKNVTDNVIEENQLTTLVSDLIENAIIAIRPCKSRHILVNLGLNKDGYYIEIADSGIPFEIDTLVHLGTMKITTNKHEGGSGIGLSSAFDLFRQNNASFIVEEFATSDSGYTKKITVAFNNKCEYIVKTPRAKEIINSPFKNDIIVKSA